MRSRPVVWFAVPLALAVTGWSLAAHAEDAKALYDKGKSLLDRGQNEQAVIALEKSYETDSNFETLYFIGKAEGALDNHKRAIRAYTRYLEEGGKKVAKKRRTEVENELARLKGVLAQTETQRENKERAGAHFQLGVKYKKAGRHEQAVYEFQQALDLYPNYKIQLSLGGSLAALGRDEQALEAYRAYLAEGGNEVLPDKRAEAEQEIARLTSLVAKNAGKRQAEQRFAEGRGFFENGQYERASNEFKRAYEADPNPKYLYSMAKTETKRGNLDVAVAAYERYLKEGGSTLGADQRGKVAQEIARLRNELAAEQNREKAQDRYRAGMDLHSKGDFAGAARAFREAYALYPAYKVLYNLGAAEAQAERFSAALEAYRKYLAEGRAEIADDRRSEVEGEIARLTDLAGKEANRQQSAARFKNGQALAQAGKHEQAAAEFEQAYNIYPNYKILYNLGKEEAALGRGDKAIAAYTLYLEQGAQEIAPDRRLSAENEIARLKEIESREENKGKAKGFYERGTAAFAAGDFAKAAAAFKASYDLFPNYKILYELGRSYAKTDNTEEAIESYERYLDEGAKDIPAERRDQVKSEVQRLGGELARSEQKQKSRDHYEAGIALRDQGKHAEAAAELSKAYELFPSYKILYHLAKAEAESDNPAAAINDYNRFLQEGEGKIDPGRSAEVNREIERLYGDVGLVEVKGVAAGAVVILDAKSVAKVPLRGPIAVAPGTEHRVTVKVGDSPVLNRDVVLAAGERTTLESDIGIDMASAAPSESLLPDEEVSAEGGAPKRLWTWVSFGVGGGALLGAVVTGAVALSKESEARDLCPDNKCPYDESTIKKVNDLKSSVRSLGITTDVLIGVGVAGAAAGALLFFFEPKLVSGAEVNVAPAASADSAGLVVSGTF